MTNDRDLNRTRLDLMISAHSCQAFSPPVEPERKFATVGSGHSTIAIADVQKQSEATLLHVRVDGVVSASHAHLVQYGQRML
jgi:hypothetical protein